MLFQQLVEANESTGTLNLFEGIRLFDPVIRLYNSGLNECFSHSAANVAMATTRLSWTAQHAVEDVVQEMCEAEARRTH